VIRTYSTPVETPKTKVWKSAEEAIKDVETGQTLMVGGFGLAGVPGIVYTFLWCAR
jgi:3-oxoacid CoA-transferase